MARKKSRTRWHLAVIVILIVGFYYWKPLTKAADTTTASIAGYVINVYHAVENKIHAIKNRFASTHALTQELARVESERTQLLAQLTTCNAEDRYARDTQELIQFRQQYQQFAQAHIVQILMKHFGTDSHYFLIKGGSNDGFTINMVATINNHLVGRIAELYPTYSKVQLLTDNMMKVAACSTQTQGIFTGTGNTQEAVLNFVDHLQEISVGDMVLTSGTGLIYPPGLCLGTVTRATKKDVSYEIYVKPLIDFEKLTYCLLSPTVTDQQPVKASITSQPELEPKQATTQPTAQTAIPTEPNNTEEITDQAEAEDAD